MNRNPETAAAASGFFTDGEMRNRTEPAVTGKARTEPARTKSAARPGNDESTPVWTKSAARPGRDESTPEWMASALHTVEAYLEDRRRVRGIRRSTEAAYRSDLKKLIAYADRNGCTGFDDMCVPFLRGFTEFLLESGESVRTVSRTVGSVKGFFRYLFQHGHVLLNYAEDMEVPRKETIPPRVLSLEEISRLLDTPDPKKPGGLRDKALMELMYASGLKVSEVTGLRVGDIDLQISCVILPGRGKDRKDPENNPEAEAGRRNRESAQESEKSRRIPDRNPKKEVNPPKKKADRTGDSEQGNPDAQGASEAGERFVPFGSRAREALKRYLLSQRERITGDESPLFVSRSGDPMSRQSVWKLIRKYADQAGIEECSPGMFRTSLAVHLLESGADPESVKDILGYSDLNSIRRYESGGEGNRLRKVYDRTQKLN